MAYYGASCFGFRWIGAAAVILGCSFARFFVGENFGTWAGASGVLLKLKASCASAESLGFMQNRQRRLSVAVA